MVDQKHYFCRMCNGEGIITIHEKRGFRDVPVNKECPECKGTGNGELR